MMPIIESASPNFEARRAVNGAVGVRHLVLHYTGMISGTAALDRLCDPASRVSAHYMIDENGDTYHLVPEEMRAWHAGNAYWRGMRDINSTSIGIELVNPGHDHGYRVFPATQMDAFIKLSHEIMKRHGISAASVLGHSDIAPGRKIDPGELFPWQDLAAQGIGLWPKDDASTPVPDARAAIAKLSAIGYAVPTSAELGADLLNKDTGTTEVLSAFQRRYRQDNVDGVLDAETARRIAAVAAVSAILQA